MKFPVRFLSVLAGLIASLLISEAAKDVDSEMERIVGGRRASEGQFPFTAALYKDGSFICTSSIIGETTVLTAAHCVVRNGVTEPAGSFYAIANLNRSSESVRIDFESIMPHPDYSESGIQNDIAVFKTTEPIPFSDTVQPICIARSDTGPREYTDLIAMGWGNTLRTRFIANIPEILHYVEQRQVGTLECRLAYLGSPLEDYKICAGRLLQGICNGDSGGPLIFDDESDEQDPVQIGIASYGNAITGCGLLTPSVWTRTSSFNDFIKEVAGNDPAICEI
ncbi:serine protease [Corynebacterium sp. MC-04]|uniref:serine protease n=1 Tax=Corynebacterium parakroppenstedtii TaxID=2828363 RepID=UPI001F2BEA22|nr:serine protease [Corynebacterium parakroppenstedtii]MCF6810737.1 serine protease [Corynebacterium parakroppenstedtii]